MFKPMFRHTGAAGQVILAIMPTLAVLGAGPKGIAIAAKARALEAAGLGAPKVILIDPGAVAGNWSGRQGYTNGLLPLGTPPEKDVGFPYADSWGPASPAVTAAMADYTWQRHLIAHGAYAELGGPGPHAAHAPAVELVPARGRREGASRDHRGRRVGRAGGRRRAVAGDRGARGRYRGADGVVVTGAGPPIRVSGQPDRHPRVLDGRSYWLHEHAISTRVAQNACVIGSGETAASVVINLVSKLPKHSSVDVLTSRGVLYSRGESYEENRLYSDPGDWPGLAEAHRREFLVRTDRGVVSRQAEAILNQSRGFRTLAGRAAASPGRRVQVVVTIEYGDGEQVAYDLVVVAIGFEPRWFEGLLGVQARHRLDQAVADTHLERRIEVDLSVAGRRPPLHLPVAAGSGTGLPQPELPGPAERSHPAPLRGAARVGAPGRGEQGPGEERACLRYPTRCGRATTAYAARSSCRPGWPSRARGPGRTARSFVQ